MVPHNVKLRGEIIRGLPSLDNGLVCDKNVHKFSKWLGTWTSVWPHLNNMWSNWQALYVMDSFSMQHRFLAGSRKKTLSGVCFTTGHRSQAKLPPTEDRARVRFFWKRKTNIKWAQSYCKGCNRCSTLRLSRLQLRCGFHVRCQIKDVSNYAKRQILYPGGSSNSSNSRMLLSILTEHFPHKINNSLPMFWADSPLSYPTVCTYVPEL